MVQDLSFFAPHLSSQKVRPRGILLKNSLVNLVYLVFLSISFFLKNKTLGLIPRVLLTKIFGISFCLTYYTIKIRHVNPAIAPPSVASGLTYLIFLMRSRQGKIKEMLCCNYTANFYLTDTKANPMRKSTILFPYSIPPGNGCSLKYI